MQSTETIKLFKGEGSVLRMCLIFIVLSCCVIGCARFNSYCGIENDGFFEELGEDIIEHELGLPENSIDFTPR